MKKLLCVVALIASLLMLVSCSGEIKPFRIGGRAIEEQKAVETADNILNAYEKDKTKSNGWYKVECRMVLNQSRTDIEGNETTENMNVEMNGSIYNSAEDQRYSIDFKYNITQTQTDKADTVSEYEGNVTGVGGEVYLSLKYKVESGASEMSAKIYTLGLRYIDSQLKTMLNSLTGFNISEIIGEITEDYSGYKTYYSYGNGVALKVENKKASYNSLYQYAIDVDKNNNLKEWLAYQLTETTYERETEKVTAEVKVSKKSFGKIEAPKDKEKYENSII